MKTVEARTGILKRHIATEDETALDLAFKACQKLFEKHDGLRHQIDGILFCTQSPDYVMPQNACILHKLLELPENTFAVDINMACSGYIYTLSIARGLIHTGIAHNVLLINADTYSKYIHDKDRATRVIFGDGGAVSWITSAESHEGIIDMQCATSGANYDKFMIKAGACRIPKSEETSVPTTDSSGNVHTMETIEMDGAGILKFVSEKVPKQVVSILERNNYTIEDVDLFIFHQASKMVLDSLSRLLRIKKEKVFSNLQNIGNTVSASIPIALKDAMEEGKISKGDTVLISGFGVGLSWGTALIKI